MSYAITALGLQAPPVAVERLGNRNVAVWRVRCACGATTKSYPLIGAALGEHATHEELHKLRLREAS